MKKTYGKPEADKISFNYRNQVVVASGNNNNPNDNIVCGTTSGSMFGFDSTCNQ